MITVFSGGTGTPKLIQGLRLQLREEDITIIGNIADDYSWYSIPVSPDVDTLLYLLSDWLDLEKLWGVKDDSYNCLETLRELNEDPWFNLGDRDLALCILRGDSLKKGHTPTEFTVKISKQLGIKAKILPPSNDAIQTWIKSSDRIIHFQEYWVKHRGKVKIDEILFKGLETAKATEEVLNALETSERIIIGPSNPITSIYPIIGIKEIGNYLRKNRQKVIAVSPIIGTTPVSGPAAELMKSQGVSVSPDGIASFYEPFCKTLVIDASDEPLKSKLEQKFDLNIYSFPTLMTSLVTKEILASYILSLPVD
ncbi:MAG: 2-phospho-L-lactate transferase [Candidatus Kariarchaeaceae archaeon]